MSLTPCHQLAKDLKAAIDARMLGTQAQSVGHKGRNVQFADVSLDKLIAYYRQTRFACPDAMADSDLHDVLPLDGPVGTRGAPMIFSGGGRV